MVEYTYKKPEPPTEPAWTSRPAYHPEPVNPYSHPVYPACEGDWFHGATPAYPAHSWTPQAPEDWYMHPLKPYPG